MSLFARGFFGGGDAVSDTSNGFDFAHSRYGATFRYFHNRRDVAIAFLPDSARI